MTLAAAALPTGAHAAAPAVPGQLVVGYEADSTATERAEARAVVDGSATRLGTPRLEVVRVDPDASLPRAARVLEHRDGVRFAEPNWIGRVAAGPPGDPLFDDQPALDRISAADAWAVATGTTDVGIGILDTGVELTHPDLAATGTDVPATGNAFRGHGTEVAGIAAAQGDNGVGVTGVTWRSDLRAFAACDGFGVCPVSSQAAAITAASNAGMDIAVMSIDSPAGSVPSEAVRSAIASSRMLIVAAAGNGARNVDVAGQASYPCSYDLPNVVCVAATQTRSDASYGSTNFGLAGVDLAAPGSQPRAETDPPAGVLTTQLGGGYGPLNGTSAAAPVVAGTAALMLAADPDLDAAGLKAALLATVDKTITAGNAATTVSGGRLNAARAVASVAPSPTVRVAHATQAAAGEVQFAANRPGTTFRCGVDGGQLAPCTSPFAFDGLLPGRHAVRIGPVDAAGGERPATEVPVAVAPTARFAGTEPAADEDGATFECRRDAVTTFAACDATPQPAGDWQGARATGTGGTGPVAWRDARPPSAEFTTEPDAVVDTRATTIAFAADEPATWRCRLDGAAPVPCSSPVVRTLPDTPAGDPDHTLVATPTDRAGNVGEPVATSWRVASSDPAAPALTLAGPRGEVRTPNVQPTVLADPADAVTCTLDGGPPGPCGALTNLPEGEHVLAATATDAATGATTTASLTFTVDTSAPRVTLTDGPPPLGRGGADRIAWATDDADADLRCSLDDGVPVTCDGNFDLPADLASGDHRLSVVAIDAAGNESAPALWRWTVDDVAPLVTAVTPRTGGAADAPAFDLTLDDASAATECRLDSGDWRSCQTGVAFDRVPEGAHHLYVRATDALGNAAEEPFEHRFAVTWPAGPAVTAAPPSLSNSTTATFIMAGALAYQCSLDDGPFTSCGQQRTYADLAQGRHRLAVRALEPSLTEPTTRTWTVDTVAPALSLLAVSADDVSFEVEPGATVSCQIDGGAATPCASPVPVAGAAAGAHELAVVATDAAGNVSRAVARWTVPTPVVPVLPPLATAPPTPTPTPTRTPMPAPEPATPPTRSTSTASVVRAVQRRFDGLSGARAARVEPFRIAYRAATAGTLRVRVLLRARGRWRTVAAGTLRYRTGGRGRVRVAATRTGKRELRATRRPQLRYRATFAPPR